MTGEFKNLATKLGHDFNDLSLLKTALTHRSNPGENNERLEFLGDSIVNFFIAEAAYRQFPEAEEGQMSRLRARLVCGETLAELAAEIGLSDYLLLGRGELKSGGHKRRSILADALEAVVAAIYVDGGMEACRAFVARTYLDRLAKATLEQSAKDSKTQVQEYLQARHLSLPKYKVKKIHGHAHEQMFTVHCEVKGVAFTGVGNGRNRRKAEQQAALKFLEQAQQQALDGKNE